MNPGHDPRRRHRHTRLRNPHALGQQPHRFHEVVIVQKRFAHAHEHDVDTLQRRLNALLPEHRRDLTDDFSRLQIPLHPKQRRKTELAIHRASHLARYANRGPTPPQRSRSTFDLVPRFASVTALPAITLRHPDRLHCLAVGQFHQIPYRAVARNKLARNPRKPDLPTLLRQTSAIFERQCRHLIQPLNLLPIYRIK